MNKKDLLLAIMLAKSSTTLGLKELKKMIADCGDVIEKIGFDKEKLTGFIKILYQASDEDEDIYPRLKLLLAKNHMLGIRDAKNPAYKSAKKLIHYAKKNGCRDYDLKTFLEFLADVNAAPEVGKPTASALTDATKIKTYFEKQSPFSNKDMKWVQMTKMSFVIKEIQGIRKNAEEVYQELISYYESLNRKEQSKQKAYQRELTALTVFEENLPQLLASGEIKNAQELLKKITSEKIRLEILKLVYAHNLEIYQDLEAEHQRLSSSPANKYQSLLNKYGIPKDSYLVASVMGNSLIDVEEMLKSITSLGITNPATILKIAQRSNLIVINALNTQVAKGIISPSLLQEYPSLFFGDSKEYERFTTNLAYMRGSGLNPYYLRENQDLFLLPNRSLRKNFKTLEDYNLLSSMKVGISCSFLVHENLESGIDTLLELGYEKFLEQNISLLNYQDNFNRLRVLKELNIPVTSSEELEKVLTTDKFLVPDDCIEDYVYNASAYRCPSISLSSGGEEIGLPSLDNFKSSERTYNIGGVILSKNRVQRNLDAIKDASGTTDLLYALTNGSHLSDEEFDTVVTVILPSAKSTVKAKIG